MNKLRLATVFSGIGSIEFALKRLGINHEIVFACDNGERDDVVIDYDREFDVIKNLGTLEEKHKYQEDLYNRLTKRKNYVQESYMANYECPNSRFYQDIKLLDGRDFKGKVDLFVGGSPCQSFSSVGFQGGLEDTRGTLFYDFARLVKEIEPKVFIYENVRNLLNHDGGKTWDIIKNVFYSLGYCISYKVLNAADYGIPQTRRRLFVVGYKTKNVYFRFPDCKELKFKMADFMIDNCAFGEFVYGKDGELIVGKKKGTVAFVKAANKKTVTVPATIRLNNKTFEVVQINANAFKGKNITNVTIEKNVKTISANAFKNSKVKTVTLKTKNLTKKSVKGALKGSSVKAVNVKLGDKALNKKYIKKYSSIFTKDIVGATVSVR